MNKAQTLEDEIFDQVSPDEILKHIEYLSEKIGTRESCSVGEYNAALYARNLFESYGLPTKIEEFDAYIDRSIESKLRMIKPEYKDIICESLGFCASTHPDGVTGTLTYVGFGTEQEYTGKDAKDKFVLVDSGKIRRGEKGSVAQEHEALGVIMISPFYGQGYTGDYINQIGTMASHMGNPVTDTRFPQIPVITVSYDDGQNLKKFLEKGAVTLWMKVKRERVWTRSCNVVATLEGSKKPDQEISIGAHLDNWGCGAYDGGSQLGQLFEMARVMSKVKGKIDRTVKFCCWGAHEYANIGSFVHVFEKHWDESQKKAVMHINVGPGFPWRGFEMKPDQEFRTHASFELEKMIRSVVAKYGLEKVWMNDSPIYTIADNQSFFLAGVATIHARGWYMTHFSPIWHAKALDTFRTLKVDPQTKADAKKLVGIWGTMALRVANSQILPYDFASWAERIRADIEGLRSETLDFSELLKKTDALQEVAKKLSESISRLELAALKSIPSKLKHEFEKHSDAMDRALMDAGRTLVSSICNLADYRTGRAHTPWPEKKIQAPTTRLPSLAAELARLNPESGDYASLRKEIMGEISGLTNAVDKIVGAFKEIDSSSRRLLDSLVR